MRIAIPGAEPRHYLPDFHQAHGLVRLGSRHPQVGRFDLERIGHGGIVITLPNAVTIELGAEDWARIVAHLSVSGVTTGVPYARALALHMLQEFGR